MADKYACNFHQFGHCKFGAHCHKKHTKETCTNFPCTLLNCTLRHPKLCRYFLLSGQCKFKEDCSFLHKMNNKEIELEKQVMNLKEEVEAIKKKIDVMKSVIESLDSSNSTSFSSESQTVITSSATTLPAPNPSFSVTTLETCDPTNSSKVSFNNSIPQLDGLMRPLEPSLASSDSLKCDTCHTEFETVDQFKDHDSAQFCCDECGICYKIEGAAHLHELEFHPNTHYDNTYIPQESKLLFASNQSRKPS